jgi:Flp pilus assembly pilin Flp
MNTTIPIIVDGRKGILARSKSRAAELSAKARERLCLMDARIRTVMDEPEEGAATAEYAVVLVAATGFAALLVAILKSDAIRTLLTNIVKKALNVG